MRTPRIASQSINAKPVERATLDSLRHELNMRMVGAEGTIREELWSVCVAALQAADRLGVEWSASQIIEGYVKPYARHVMIECGMLGPLEPETEAFTARAAAPANPRPMLRALVRARAGLQENPSAYTAATCEWAQPPELARQIAHARADADPNHKGIGHETEKALRRFGPDWQTIGGESRASETPTVDQRVPDDADNDIPF